MPHPEKWKPSQWVHKTAEAKLKINSKRQGDAKHMQAARCYAGLHLQLQNMSVRWNSLPSPWLCSQAAVSLQYNREVSVLSLRPTWHRNTSYNHLCWSCLSDGITSSLWWGTCMFWQNTASAFNNIGRHIWCCVASSRIELGYSICRGGIVPSWSI